MSWDKIKIKDLAKVSGGKRLPKGHDFVDSETEHRYIRARDIGEGQIDKNNLVFINNNTYQKLSRYSVNEGDIVITIVGANIGDVGYISEELEDVILTENAAKIHVDRKKCYPLFLKYYLLNPYSRKILNYIASGSAQGKLGLYKIKDFEVKLPALSVQKEIASILSFYDELIQNNKRRIELLEKSASLLYKEWFVQLRFPGHEHSKNVDGVPEGWEKLKIGDVFDTTSGGTPSRKNPEYFTGDINWAKTQELNEGYLFETEEKITEQAINNSSAKLFSSETLLVSIYGGTNIGRSAILANPSASNQACVALWPNHPAVSNYYGQLFFQHNRSNLIGLAQGAAQTNISQKVLKSVEILVPTESLHEYFLSIVVPIYGQVKRLQLSLNHLKKARDLLLPKLMNGDIPV